MSVNNVTGAIEPVEELVKTVRDYEKETKRKILFFSDSVQALGKTDLRLREWDVDAASFSAHKINGPRGIGLLYTKNPELIHPLAPAGGQERESVEVQRTSRLLQPSRWHSKSGWKRGMRMRKRQEL